MPQPARPRVRFPRLIVPRLPAPRSANLSLALAAPRAGLAAVLGGVLLSAGGGCAALPALGGPATPPAV